MPWIYLYDAQTGSLVCASCDPTGASPVGDASLNTGLFESDYRPRDLLGDGTLFFESSDALVRHADDGRQNVYEYEDGRVYPISNVAGRYEAFFLDASPDGSDVFFATADQLLPEDEGDNVVVYDARAGGGFPVPVSVAVCDNADSCKSPVSPQPGVFGAPASATFSGPGNPASSLAPPVHRTVAQERAEGLAKRLGICRRERKRTGRKACERLARRRYGAGASAKKSGKARRATTEEGTSR